MHISININTDEPLSELDLRVLRAFVGAEETNSAERAAEAAKLAERVKESKPAPAKKAAAPKKEKPEPEEPEEEDAEDEGTEDDGPTKADAVARATQLIQEDRADDVKAALTKLGVKRVGQLEDKHIPKFLALLED